MVMEISHTSLLLEVSSFVSCSVLKDVSVTDWRTEGGRGGEERRRGEEGRRGGEERRGGGRGRGEGGGGRRGGGGGRGGGGRRGGEERRRGGEERRRRTEEEENRGRAEEREEGGREGGGQGRLSEVGGLGTQQQLLVNPSRRFCCSGTCCVSSASLYTTRICSDRLYSTVWNVARRPEPNKTIIFLL